jgi:Crp-like helix-turn-helix domain
VGGGGVFGERSLEGGGTHRDNAEASLEGCRVATVGKGALARHPLRPRPARGLRGVGTEEGGRDRAAAAQGVRTRLASLLLELDVRPGLEVGPGGERLTQERLAEMVACCREAVSPDLASLRREGVLGVGVLRTSCVGGSPTFVRTGSSEVAQWARAGRLDRGRANWHRVREFGAEGGRRAETTHLWSFRFTTPAFRFRAVLTGDGSEEVELAKA